MGRSSAFNYLLGLEAGTVLVVPDRDKAYNFVARLLSDTVQYQPSAVLGLPTGATFETPYQRTAAVSERHRVSWCGVTTFNMDCALVSDGHGALRPYDRLEFFDYPAFMEAQLFAGLAAKCGFDRGNVRFPVPLTPGWSMPEAGSGDIALTEYDDKIALAGGIMLLLAGLGRDDCHIAYNQPGTSALTRSRVVRLSDTVRRVYVDQAEGRLTLDETPTHGATMGIATMLRWTQHCVMCAFGASKSWAVQRAVSQPSATPDVPASYFVGPNAMHPRGILIVDSEAAAGIVGEPFVKELSFDL